MPRFDYEARDSGGHLRRGVVLAPHIRQAVHQLQEQSMIVVTIKELNDDGDVKVVGSGINLGGVAKVVFLLALAGVAYFWMVYRR